MQPPPSQVANPLWQELEAAKKSRIDAEAKVTKVPKLPWSAS